MATNCIRLEYSSSTQRSLFHTNRKWLRLAILKPYQIWVSPDKSHIGPFLAELEQRSRDQYVQTWNSQLSSTTISTSKSRNRETRNETKRNRTRPSKHAQYVSHAHCFSRGSWLMLDPVSTWFSISRADIEFTVIYVTGSEKRGNFSQNANFYHFLNCHHAKAFRALDFPLALQTLQAF